MNNTDSLALVLSLTVAAGGTMIYIGSSGRRPRWARFVSLIFGWALIVPALGIIAGIGGLTNPPTLWRGVLDMTSYLPVSMVAFIAAAFLLVCGIVGTFASIHKLRHDPYGV